MRGNDQADRFDLPSVRCRIAQGPEHARHAERSGSTRSARSPRRSRRSRSTESSRRSHSAGNAPCAWRTELATSEAVLASSAIQSPAALFHQSPRFCRKARGKGALAASHKTKQVSLATQKPGPRFLGAQASCHRSDQKANSHDPTLLLSVGDLHGLSFLGNPEHADKQNNAEDDVEYPYGAQDGIRAGNGGDGLVDG